MNAQHGWKYSLLNIPTETRVGTQNLYNEIHNGNGDLSTRQQYDFITDNYIKEYFNAAWTDTTLKWTPWLRTTGAFPPRLGAWLGEFGDEFLAGAGRRQWRAHVFGELQ